MFNAEGVQKEPYLIIGPLDDWGDEERFVASDAADGTLVTGIGDVYLVNATLCWPAALLTIPLVTELIKTFKGTAVLMVGNLDLTPTRTLSAFSVTDTDENYIACTDTFFIDSAAPSYQSCREHTFLASLIVDTNFRLYHIYVRILLAAEHDYFRRINRCKPHVSLELHTCNLGDMIKALAILPCAEREIEAFVRRVCQRKLFSLSQQLYRVLYLLLEVFRELRKNIF